MDSLQDYNEYDDQQKNSQRYKIALFIGLGILVIIAFFAMLRVGWKLTALRNTFWQTLQVIAVIAMLIGIGIWLFLGLVNQGGKNTKQKQ